MCYNELRNTVPQQRPKGQKGRAMNHAPSFGNTESFHNSCSHSFSIAVGVSATGKTLVSQVPVTGVNNK
ncbi:MAG: hypothetical protein AAB513_02885 [Patescibacteria group bacterium]